MIRIHNRGYMHTIDAEIFFRHHHYPRKCYSDQLQIWFQNFSGILKETTSILQMMDREDGTSEYALYCGECGERTTPSIGLEIYETSSAGHFYQFKDAMCRNCGQIFPSQELCLTRDQSFLFNSSEAPELVGDIHIDDGKLILRYSYREATLYKGKRRDRYAHIYACISLEPKTTTSRQYSSHTRGPVRRVPHSKNIFSYKDAKPDHFNAPYRTFVSSHPEETLKALHLLHDHFRALYPHRFLMDPEEYLKDEEIQSASIIDALEKYVYNPSLTYRQTSGILVEDYLMYFVGKKDAIRSRKQAVDFLFSLENMSDVFSAFGIPRARTLRKLITKDIGSIFIIHDLLQLFTSIDLVHSVSSFYRGTSFGFNARSISVETFLREWISEKGEAVVARKLTPLPDPDDEHYRNNDFHWSNAHMTLIRDAARAFYDIRKIDPEYQPSFEGSLQVIHDRIALDYDKLKHPKKVFSYPKKVINWAEEEEDYVFELPESNHDMIKMGREMHICVGSYAGRVSRKRTWVVRMRKKDSEQTDVCIEVNPSGEIIQAKGYYNQQPDKSLQERILEWAKKKSLTPSTYDLRAAR